MKRMMLLALALCMAMCLYTSQALATMPAESYAWYDATKTNLEISSAADLLGFAKIVSGDTGGGIPQDGFKGKTVTLTADIDLGGIPWNPIGISQTDQKGYEFFGVFDGNGKTISNFTFNGTTKNLPDRGRYGFFYDIGRYTDAAGNRVDGMVKNLTLSNITATIGGNDVGQSTGYRFGTLACLMEGGATHVTIKNVQVTTASNTAWVAGMSAFTSWPHNLMDNQVENFTVNAEKGAYFISGFTCIFARNATEKDQEYILKRCNVKGFKVTVNGSGECGVGGLIGQTQRGWESPRIEDCHVSGMDVTASGTVGVGGFIAWPGAHTTVVGCTTQGKIDATGITDGYAGGFFGNLGWNNDLGHMGHKISDCTANVDIVTKTVPAGGFVGSATNSNNRSMYAEFENCTASGNITSAQGGSAPVGGFAGDADRGHYTGCKATGNVSGSVAGGFIGLVKDVKPAYDGRFPAGKRDYDANEILLDGVSASGTVLGTDKTGGLIGHVGEGTASGKGAEGKLIIRNSSATDTVVGSSQDTDVEAILNRHDTPKAMEGPDDKTTGASSIIVPVNSDSRLTMDANGDIIIPKEGATLIRNGESTQLPGGTIVRDGKIILPQPDPTPTPVPTATPEPASAPRTGVPGVEGYAVLALLSAVCAVLLLNLRRKASRG